MDELQPRLNDNLATQSERNLNRLIRASDQVRNKRRALDFLVDDILTYVQHNLPPMTMELQFAPPQSNECYSPPHAPQNADFVLVVKNVGLFSDGSNADLADLIERHFYVENDYLCGSDGIYNQHQQVNDLTVEIDDDSDDIGADGLRDIRFRGQLLELPISWRAVRSQVEDSFLRSTRVEVVNFWRRAGGLDRWPTCDRAASRQDLCWRMAPRQV